MTFGTPAIGSLSTPLIDGAMGAGSAGTSATTGADKVGSSFADMLSNRLDSLSEGQNAGNQAAQDIATNRVDDVAQAMLKVEKANVSLQFATQVRNKAIEAYQEILRMQV